MVKRVDHQLPLKLDCLPVEWRAILDCNGNQYVKDDRHCSKHLEVKLCTSKVTMGGRKKSQEKENTCRTECKLQGKPPHPVKALLGCPVHTLADGDNRIGSLSPTVQKGRVSESNKSRERESIKTPGEKNQ